MWDDPLFGTVLECWFEYCYSDNNSIQVKHYGKLYVSSLLCHYDRITSWHSADIMVHNFLIKIQMLS